MAGIDKTYTSSYSEYKKFKDWADRQYTEFFDGLRVCIGDYVWCYEESDFSRGEIPVMNTPTWMDIYLIQNCKVDFVADRMKDVYDNRSYAEFKAMTFPQAPPIGYERGRKICIKPIAGRTIFPLHSKPYGGKMTWWLQCDSIDWHYNDGTRVWTHDSQHYPSYTNTAHVKSINGVIRLLRKQYLPKGVEFRLSGRYVGEDYKIIIK